MRTVFDEYSSHVRHCLTRVESLDKQLKALAESQRYRVAVSALRCFRGIDIAERAGIRLSKRYRHLVERGKASPTAVMAVVRELVGFLWAMLRQVQEHEHKAA